MRIKEVGKVKNKEVVNEDKKMCDNEEVRIDVKEEIEKRKGQWGRWEGQEVELSSNNGKDYGFMFEVARADAKADDDLGLCVELGLGL